ncbi:hypothetical protein CE91St54_02130 [Hungatella hathewayi]|uniref:Uncharacterized protein n=1 Tax=Hungatella hathewayi TaxID=154046 RepID=A0AA37N292_9FIRM|nr:hypothetical protein CE91St55_02640 [Hungatella hathewayi]GKH05105.1 hypothetical protein CE91St54_02130 [Hungatella hathewayi]
MKWYGNGKERTDGIFEGRGWRGCDRDCADPGGNIYPLIHTMYYVNIVKIAEIE